MGAALEARDMQTLECPNFRSKPAKHIYQYVERHGTAVRHQARSVLELPAETFRAELDWLLEKGYLDEDGGTLRVGVNAGSIEEHVSGDHAYTIRPARQADFEGLLEAIRDVTAEDTYVVAESVAERLLYDEAVTRHNTVESRVFFVATDDGDIVGWAHLDLPQVEKLTRAAQLTVGVRPGARGQGVGSHLLERAIDWTEANGYEKLYNSVPATNDEALSFLESHGWHTEGIRREHYAVDGEAVDEVMMAYSV